MSTPAPTIPSSAPGPYRPDARRPDPRRVSSSPTPLITRVEPLRPRGIKVLLHFDLGDPVEIMLETLERSRLAIGDSLGRERRHNLLNDDADVRVRHAALNLLSFRARTRAELKRRRRQQGLRPARIDVCLDRLQERGLLDDGAVAEAFVRDRIRHRPRGRAALTSELRAKGVEGPLAERSIERVFEEVSVDDVSLAREVAQGWVDRQGTSTLEALAGRGAPPERDRARRRLVGYLGRRGFRGEALAAGIDAAGRTANERANGPA